MISLIVTVYNKAPFLKRCLDSIVEQYNKQAQVIVVDDGSTDGSAKICDEYPEFMVYHTKNNGVSAARNFGIDKAKGDYIAFLDADDMLMPDAIECISNKIVQSGHNVCQYGQIRGKTYETIDPTPRYSLEKFYDFSFIPKYWVLVWNKLYKKSFLTKNKIRFKEDMSFGEDTIFNCECILANGGFYNVEPAIVIHLLDDHKSLCRGNLNLDKIKKLDKEMCKLADKQTGEAASWMEKAINEHRNSKLYKKYGFSEKTRGKYDVVYFVKDCISDEELIYSLRSLEENWAYKRVWFCGGKPANLQPDRMFRIEQKGLNKYEKVRNMIRAVCENDEITEDFWLFNDDFYILQPIDEDMPAQYNKTLLQYANYIEKKQGTADTHTCSLKEAARVLASDGLTTYNYEVHKPILINRKKALEVLDKYPETPCFRSLYGNYWKVGGVDQHDMKIKKLDYKRMDNVARFWRFLSTSDTSFREGNVGEFVRNKFNKISKFEKEKNEKTQE